MDHSPWFWVLEVSYIAPVNIDTLYLDTHYNWLTYSTLPTYERSV